MRLLRRENTEDSNEVGKIVLRDRVQGKLAEATEAGHERVVDSKI